MWFLLEKKENLVMKIEWMLLTSLPINTKKQVRSIVKYYSKGWMIETFFKVLKSGCKIEELQFQSLDKFEPCLAIYLIVSWRILYLNRIARDSPNQSCDVVFSKNEWLAAYAIINKKAP